MPTLKVAQDLIDLIYPVGCLFITTDKTFNPNNTLGGTWARLEGDVYLKNVPSSSTSQPIGNYGGTASDHKIPISSMPSHSHQGSIMYTPGDTSVWNYFYFSPDGGGVGNGAWSGSLRIGSSGGGQAYYTYYYGIICWHRID